MRSSEGGGAQLHIHVSMQGGVGEEGKDQSDERNFGLIG